MAWVAREKNAHRSVAIPGRVAAKIDATPGAARAAPRRRSYRSVGENRWRFHRSALRPRRAARWRSLRARAATGAPLRAGTGFQARDSAKTETAIRRQKHSRFAFPRRVMALDRSLCAHFADIRATPDLYRQSPVCGALQFGMDVLIRSPAPNAARLRTIITRPNRYIPIISPMAACIATMHESHASRVFLIQMKTG